METTQQPAEAKPHARRDLLLQIQKQVQRKWEDAKIFEADAKSELPKEGEKFFGNFPFPYMNGMLHLGHAFTFSKVEFACAYHRLCGANVLFPFGFHCTGMPIKACADKLTREVELYGSPPSFPSRAESAAAAVAAPPAEVPEAGGGAEPAKFKGKKSKAAAKTGNAKFQWEIMASLGLSDDEILEFRDPAHWLHYFPPVAIEDLKQLGIGVDWRRTFVTTDYNPFFDSFVRWNMNTLHKKGKVVKDRRYAIYSPLDGQPCADHDRASGEGVLPQEYTLVKMEVIAPFTGKLAPLAGKKVFLAAATLRPETMYGQTNAWVLPDGVYGGYEVSESEVYVVTKRAALNMSFQYLSKEMGKPVCLVELTGHDLIGLPLKSPKSLNPVIYALPMLTILTDKGTGIVTSVPSDSPDDYMALQDLKSKPALRSKFGVQDEWVLPFEVIPVLNIPGFGDASAETVCKSLKIKSQNDKDALAEAKRLTYLKGFTEGVMVVGEYKGKRVQDAKPLIKKMLIDAGEAVAYSEPESRVVSRSGDDCVVALTDQWYITYGEDGWKAKAEECLTAMNCFAEETRHGFEHTLGWLDRWACSRSFGLGTRIPWDPQFLVESLSDSTVYMAYYTVAAILQNGDLFGQSPAVEGIKAEQLTDAVWDFLFLNGPVPQTDIPLHILEKGRHEFEYWYPFDLRASGKDLINNHLTFSIYNHTAMFPRDKWPRGMRCNGHLLLNSEKMSKSSGNFLTVREAIEEYSSDATRFALADAGDTVDDANFEAATADAAILRLTKEIAWMEEVVSAEASLRTGQEKSFADRVFDNEINIAISVAGAAYKQMLFRKALKSGFYDLQLARDNYRVACGASGMHRDILFRFMDAQTALLTPICPHYAEHVRKSILKKDGFAVTAGWPAADAPDFGLQAANKYLQDTISDFRKVLTKQLSAPKKGGGKKPVANAAPTAAAPKFTSLVIFVAEKYGGWQEECLLILQNHFNAETRTFSADAQIMAAVKGSSISQRGDSKKVMGLCMSFIKFKQAAAIQNGHQELDVKLPFDEVAILTTNAELIKRQLGMEHLAVYLVTDEEAVAREAPDSSRVQAAVPGTPVAVFQALPSGAALVPQASDPLAGASDISHLSV